MNAEAVSPVWTGAVAGGFAGGTGTETDPYLIDTGEQLAHFSQRVNSGVSYSGQYIKLTRNILLNTMNGNGGFVSGNPKEFTGIGNTNSKFNGTFDGDGFEIIGLYIDKSGTTYQGLFGYADSGCVIRDVSLSGSVAGAAYSGAVAGYTNGTIEGCDSSCTVTANWQDYHGGIVGYAGDDSSVRDCIVSGGVIGSAFVGGIAGYTAGEIINCESNATSVSGHTKVGGVVGYAATASSYIDGCSFNGSVTGSGSYYVGGIAGQAEGLIADCTVNSTVTSTNGYIGGIVGYAAGSASKIVGCTVVANVNETGGNGYAGGVAGRTDGEISSCIVKVSLTAPNSFIGGIAGYASGQNSKISDCTVSGTVKAGSGEGYVGGVAGKADGTITECDVSAEVSGVHHYVGGVVGYAGTGSEVSKSTSTGPVSGNSEVGGVAGYTDGTISVCINTGTVTGRNGHTGGIAGEAGGSAAVNNSYNSGTVDGGSGQGGIGGIVGNVSSSTKVHNNLNKGEVEGNQFVGSIIGNSLSDENAWNNYYYDYGDAPGGMNGTDVESDDAAVSVGDLTWEEIWELLNKGNEEEMWFQDQDDDGIPKPGVSGVTPDTSTSAARAGKHYTFDEIGEDISVSITADSAFTLSFDMLYGSACTLTEQKVGLLEGEIAANLPVGTSVIMLTDGIYYYVNIVAETEDIQLDEFLIMGSYTEYYPEHEVQADATKTYLFVFDFSETEGLKAGNYTPQLFVPGENETKPASTVTVESKINYDLSLVGQEDSFSAALYVSASEGYDYKADGASYIYEISILKNGMDISWPVATKINGKSTTSDLPYVFSDAAFEETEFDIDMDYCNEPLPGGNYTIQIRALASTDIAAPRGGYPVAYATAEIAITAHDEYAIRTRANERVFDASALGIPVDFTIETLGEGPVSYTLQRKYGQVYSNVAEQTEVPVTVEYGMTTLSIPAGSPKGTYRFVLSKYDKQGTKKAQTVENIIVK